MKRTVRACRPRCIVAAVCAALAQGAGAADFFWNAGDFVSGVTAPEPLGAGDTLFIQSGGAKRFVGASFTNQGLVRWQADALQGGNGALVSNAGTWQSESDANSLSWEFGGRAQFTNTGTFRKSGGSVTSVGSWAFVNSGSIDAQAGIIVFDGSSNTFYAGSKFGGAGEVQTTGTSEFRDSFMSDNLVLAGGTNTGMGAVLFGGVASGAGQMGWTGGDLRGTWTIAAGSTLTGAGTGLKRQVGSSIVNNGTFRWSTTQELQGGGGSSFTNNGLLEANASAAFNWNYGGQHVLINGASGTVRASGSSTLTLGQVNLTSNGGLFEAHAGSTIDYSGTSNRFNDGTRFAGLNQVSGNARFVDGIQADDLRFVGGVQTGGDGTPGSKAVLSGIVRWEGGDLQGNWEILSGTTLTGAGAGQKRQVGSSIVNNGTFRWSTTQELQGGNGSVLTNNGLFEASASVALNWNYGGRPILVNNAGGTVRASAGATLTLGEVGLTSNGGLFESHAGSAIVYSGSSNRFNDGTRFLGLNRVSGNARFVGGMQADDLRFVGGVQTAGDGNPGSKAAFSGVVRWEAGDLQGSWEILSGTTMTGSGAGQKRQIGSSIVNNGTFLWSTTQELQGGNGSVLTNNGLLEASASAALNWNYGGRPILINNAGGTVRASGGATLTLGELSLTSNGGLFEAQSGSAIVFNGSSNRFNDGTRFLGLNQVSGNARFVGGIQADNLRVLGGTQTGGDGATAGSTGRLAGTFAWEGGDLAGAFEIPGGATLTATTAGVKRQVGSDIVNNGIVRWNAEASMQGGNGSRLTNNGLFEITTNADLTHDYGSKPAFVNNAMLVKSSGDGETSLSGLALANNGTIDVQSGSITLPAGFVNAGTLMGVGAYNVGGTLGNSGRLAPGASPGTLTINGSFSQSASGTFDVELENLFSHDTLVVNGNANLDGTLALACFGACSLSAGAELVVLDATGELNGTFSKVTKSGFATGDFDIVYDIVQDRVLVRVLQDVSPVPEPQTYALMLCGLALVGWAARRQGRR